MESLEAKEALRTAAEFQRDVNTMKIITDRDYFAANELRGVILGWRASYHSRECNAAVRVCTDMAKRIAAVRVCTDMAKRIAKETKAFEKAHPELARRAS